MSLLKWIFGTKPKPKPKRGKIVDLEHTPKEASEPGHPRDNGQKTLSQIIAEAETLKPAQAPDNTATPESNTQEKSYPKGLSMAEKEAQHRAAAITGQDYNLNSAVTFSYVDASGRLTDRTVTPISYDGECIDARCHLRKAQRTFYLDRIQGRYHNGGYRRGDQYR